MKQWYKNEKLAEADAEKENCEIVTGSNGWTDIYYLIPKNAPTGFCRIIARANSDCQGRWCYRVIYKLKNGELITVEEATKYRIQQVKNGRVPDDKIEQYLNGYYTLREETSDLIYQRKENARISHLLCTETGKDGHEARQMIRRTLRERGQV